MRRPIYAKNKDTALFFYCSVELVRTMMRTYLLIHANITKVGCFVFTLNVTGIKYEGLLV